MDVLPQASSSLWKFIRSIEEEVETSQENIYDQLETKVGQYSRQIGTISRQRKRFFNISLGRNRPYVAGLRTLNKKFKSIDIVERNGENQYTH